MCERGEPFAEGELRNNNQRAGLPAAGDANANDIRTEGCDTSSLPRLAAETAVQDKVVIWGTDSQCDDPELAEFEMLECQELEAYLVGEGEDFVGLADCEELQEKPPSRSNGTAEQGINQSRDEGKLIRHCPIKQEPGSLHTSESRDGSSTELNSESYVFVSCLSSLSSGATAVDTLSRTQTTDSWHMASPQYLTISEDLTLASQTVSEKQTVSRTAEDSSPSSTKGTILPKDVDINLNSSVPAEDVVSKAQMHKEVKDEHKNNNNQINQAGKSTVEQDGGRTEHKSLPVGESSTKMDKSTQADEAPDKNYSRGSLVPKGNRSSVESKAIKKQGSFDNDLKKQNSFEKTVKKQPSFENTLKKQLSFDNSVKKQGSFENSSSSSLERRKPWGSPSRAATQTFPYAASSSPKRRPPGSPAKVQGIRALSLERTNSPQKGSSPAVKQPAKMSLVSGIPKPVVPQQREPEPRRSSPQKPQNVRPKIITYVRKNPQAKPPFVENQHEASGQPVRPSSYPSPPAQKEPKAGPQPKSAPVLCSSNLLFDKYRQDLQKGGYCPPGGKPSSSSVPQRLSGKSDSCHEETPEKSLQEQHSSQEAAGVYRSPRALRPQLGLGAVTRQPAAKPRLQTAGQKSGPGPSQSAPDTKTRQDPAGEKRSSGPGLSAKSLLLKPGQSGLRPPGFSTLPPPRLAALGCVRSSNVSSVSGGQANDGGHIEASHGQASQLHGKAAGDHRAVRADRDQELARDLIQQLRDRCEQQELQLQSLQAQLKKASLCMDVFSITTQHFCHKSESAVVKERELTQELARIRDEVAFSVAHWEQLQQEKQDLEHRFEAELLGLRARQQRELGELEERLKEQHGAETEFLQLQQRVELEELRFKQQGQIEEMTENHEASLMEMEMTHNDTLFTLQEEHARTVKNLKMAHEQQKKSLEDEFKKIRLALQDQVDTLTFQNRSLRDRAKRFEEALRKSTDEQIVDALAPYKHIEEDLKSLKEVLEMKNQQIHQQELKISELEKIAEKNVYLEERVQVLQQQNEDLKERIDKNLAVSRQLSEENANLQVHVEKESNEKKRLSRTNEELLWRLQTGELSPHMSPTSSPIHRPASGPGSPARPHSYHQ